MDDIFVPLEFSSEELSQVPERHVAFLMSSCLAISEITVFLRMLLFALNSAKKDISDGVILEYASVQSSIIERNLSSKLYEYLNALDDYVKLCRRKKESEMSEFIDIAAASVESARLSPTYALAEKLRNKMTSHYSIHHMMDELRAAPAGRQYISYLHEKSANSLYPIAEHLVLGNLFESDGGVEAHNEYGAYVRRLCDVVQTLHAAFMLKFRAVYFPDKELQELSVKVEDDLVGSVKLTCLPVVLDLRKPK